MQFRPIVKSRKGAIADGMEVLGIDIGSVEHVVRFWAAPGEREVPVRVANTAEGVDQVLALLDARTGGERSRAVVGFEPTGSYWQGFIVRLKEAGVKIRVIQPLHTKRYKEIMDNSPNKSDDKDAGTIAELTKRGHGLLLRVPTGVYGQLRALNDSDARATQHITRLKNQLRDLAGQLFPELVTEIDPFSATGRQILQKTPTPSRWLAIRRGRRVERVRKASRGRLGEAFVDRLTQAARRSLGQRDGIEPRIDELQFGFQELARLEAFRERLEKQRVACLPSCTEAESILSIPDLGASTVARILAETGRLTDFETSGSVLKHGGINLYAISTGKRNSTVVHYHLTKRGRSRLRHILYFAALRLVQRGAIYHDFYTRLVSHGTAKIAALVAVMRKLLGLVYALARDRACFDPVQHASPAAAR